MDSNNWRAAQAQFQIPGQSISGESVVPPGMEAGDWRNQLQADSRQRIVNKIMETLKRHLPFSGPEGLQELKKIAMRFEEKIYTAATSQSDYLRKISLKMLTMETKSQNPLTNPLQPNTASNSKNPQDPVTKQETGSNNWGAAEAQLQIPGQSMSSESVVPPGMEAGDWRNRLQADSRQRIVNKIMKTLKRHLPFSGQEGPEELKKIAMSSEEKIYTAATSQSDYFRKISFKMLTMETKSQNPLTNPLQPNTASNSKNPQDPVTKQEMDSNNCGAAEAQLQIPGQSMSSESVVPPGMEAGDWRNRLQADSRQRIVNKIMKTLKRHLPFSGQEGPEELKKIAMSLEEKIYTAATSQSDYLRKISVKMLTMETKSQNPLTNPFQTNTASNNKNP